MRKSLISEIVLYEKMTRYLAEYDDDEEVVALFAGRDVIQDAISREEEISSEFMTVLKKGDDRVVGLWRDLSERFPHVFEPGRKADISREYWWWHLDEGPQVREEAEKAKIA